MDHNLLPPIDINIIMRIFEVLQKQQLKDPMSGTAVTAYTATSTDGQARLQINQEPQGVMVYFTARSLDFIRGDGKVKFGSGAVEEANFWREGSSNTASFGSTSNIGQRILKHSGELRFQMPILGKGPVVFVFSI